MDRRNSKDSLLKHIRLLEERLDNVYEAAREGLDNTYYGDSLVFVQQREKLEEAMFEGI